MTDRHHRGLAVTIEGSGPPLLFLHGIGSSRAAFDAQCAHFADRYRCIVPDAPGYADSTDRDMNNMNDMNDMNGMDGYAAVYETLLDELGGRHGAQMPAAVVGVSFGGVVAARMAIRGLTPLSSLVLADTSRGSGADPTKADAMRARPEELAAIGAVEFAAKRTPRLLSDGAPPELIERVRDAMAKAIRLPGYAQAASAMADTDHSDRLNEIGCPTLVLVGEHDVVCPPTEAERIVQSIADATLAIVPGAGHLANQEQPAEFNALVDDFLALHHPTEHHPTDPTEHHPTDERRKDHV